MRIERGVWQSGEFASSNGQTSGELSTVGAEGLSVAVAPVFVVFVAVDVDVPVLPPPNCVQAVSNKHIATKGTMRRGKFISSRLSMSSGEYQ